MWVAKLYPYRRPNTHITSGGLGTMGFAVPAAMGAALARPDEPVWAISGDGGFQMNMQEIATMVQEGIPVKMAVFNNGYLGMVRQWQQFFHGRRYSATPIWSPDYVRLAEAYGIFGRRVERGDRGGRRGARGDRLPGPGPGRVPDRAGGERLPDDSAGRLALRADRGGARRPAARAGMSVDPRGPVLLEDQLITLNRAVGLIRRRNFPVRSLSVGPTDTPGVSRLTIMMQSDEATAERAVQHLQKIIGVRDATAIPQGDAVARELALVKLRPSAERYAELLDVVQLYHATRGGRIRRCGHRRAHRLGGVRALRASGPWSDSRSSKWPGAGPSRWSRGAAELRFGTQPQLEAGAR